MPNPACVAYEAYRQYANANCNLSAYLLPWDVLPDAEKKAWWEVVRVLAKTMKGGAQ